MGAWRSSTPCISKHKLRRPSISVQSKSRWMDWVICGNPSPISHPSSVANPGPPSLDDLWRTSEPLSGPARHGPAAYGHMPNEPGAGRRTADTGALEVSLRGHCCEEPISGFLAVPCGVVALKSRKTDSCMGNRGIHPKNWEDQHVTRYSK